MRIILIVFLTLIWFQSFAQKTSLSIISRPGLYSTSVKSIFQEDLNSDFSFGFGIGLRHDIKPTLTWEADFEFINLKMNKKLVIQEGNFINTYIDHSNKPTFLLTNNLTYKFSQWSLSAGPMVGFSFNERIYHSRFHQLEKIEYENLLKHISAGVQLKAAYFFNEDNTGFSIEPFISSFLYIPNYNATTIWTGVGVRYTL